ncbi:MAG: hypothetical protein LBO09_03630 [Candidatus Peribacteria bacterium]|jgi:hypothetical protein|nr:hypothetical protein [Candidatus Peribacteria bacterium]
MFILIELAVMALFFLGICVIVITEDVCKKISSWLKQKKEEKVRKAYLDSWDVCGYRLSTRKESNAYLLALYLSNGRGPYGSGGYYDIFVRKNNPNRMRGFWSNAPELEVAI